MNPHICNIAQHTKLWTHFILGPYHFQYAKTNT